MGRQDDTGIVLLERAAGARGRLLRVEQLPLSEAPGDAMRGHAYLLTFDVGRVLVGADAAAAGLEIRQLRSREKAGGDLRALDEEEPWWRVAGNSITRVWPGAGGEGAASGEGVLRDVRMQFREDGENPKVISLRLERGAVAVAEEKRDGG